ncbi:arsenate reductase/protein-tyrosine-phosphatase family protein [Pseudonocardia bannensis]|uniref:Low molecular weight phosphatase family protein n=1 Tax=Pseudonocardia bannensis TaxID=630973 RepID=A0A848DHB0_9PSEU|nr:low molecular weight phosphatase family protein [Pseudonocardia bannensis]NMH91923.1 low molecular weight phosphatase family protein [Pseudonocardia bannensis]
MSVVVEHSRHAAPAEKMTVMGRHRLGHDDFRLLFVCTGNICRSPFAEILTRHLLIGRLGGRAAADFDIRSAGLRAVVGHQMHPDTRDELMPWRLDGAAAERFTARQLRSSMIRAADLVLCASRRHRSAVVEREPAALATAFTVREFARLVEGVDPGALPLHPVQRAHAVLIAARDRRGIVPPVPAEEDSIPDPMGKSLDAHHEAAARITASVQVIVDVIAPRHQSVAR